MVNITEISKPSVTRQLAVAEGENRQPKKVEETQPIDATRNVQATSRQSTSGRKKAITKKPNKRSIQNESDTTGLEYDEHGKLTGPSAHIDYQA